MFCIEGMLLTFKKRYEIPHMNFSNNFSFLPRPKIEVQLLTTTRDFDHASELRSFFLLIFQVVNHVELLLYSLTYVRLICQFDQLSRRMPQILKKSTMKAQFECRGQVNSVVL